jgi:hypothetical protein
MSLHSPTMLLLIILALSVANAGDLPPGGTTSWVIEAPEEIVTFVLFDPESPAVRLPAGLRFVAARDARMPEIQEHLTKHPEHEEWAFSFIEITRQQAFVIDGEQPSLAENAGIGLWFAPVDASQLADAIDKDAFEAIVASARGAVLSLGIWVPDREFVEFIRARGHHAEFGQVTLVRDDTGTYRGEIQLDNLLIRSVATPQGEAQETPGGGTQVLFAPGESVTSAVVVAGSTARHRACTADWSKEGDHPLSRGVFVGPTYMTTYDVPLVGSAFSLGEKRER